ncbi:MAG TPA: hypothetical protein VHM70_10590 [Polyangiaceae bacterium]|nr:hypothetical protein [Polyangiaceae bacterium]
MSVVQPSEAISYRASRRKSIVWAGVLGILGLVLLAIGWTSFVQGSNGAALLLGGGMIWAWVSLTLAFDAADPALPVSGRFDDARSAFVVCAADGATSEIAYSQIVELRVRRSESRTRNGTQVYFIAYLEKRDGGFWDLESFREESPALQLVESINARGVLGRTAASALAVAGGQTLPSTALPKTIARQVDRDTTTFLWSSRGGALALLANLIGVSGLGLIVRGVLDSMHLTGAIPSLLALGFWAFLVWLVIRHSGRQFRLALDPRFLTYAVRPRFARRFGASKILEHTSELCLQLNFDVRLAGQQRSHQLTFVQKSDSERLRQLDQHRLRDQSVFNELRALEPRLLRLDLPGIRTQDALAFERCLQEELERRGHVVL